MKAVRAYRKDDNISLVFEDAPDPPEPGAGQILVQVRAAGLTPTEVGWRPTWQTAAREPRFAPILGHEFSGVVKTVGAGVTQVAPGEEVYGVNDWFTDGALAELVLADANGVAAKPAKIDHETAAVLPISGLTAWQALFVKGKIQAGQRVLIHGGAGAVGSTAVQLARWRSATVIATASARNLSFVRELGAQQVIDYRATPFETQVRDIDLVVDTVGSETLERSYATLRAGGRIVSVASNARGREEFMLVEPNREQLIELARLADAGTLRPIVDRIVRLQDVPEARGQKSTRGKIAVRVAQ